MRLTITIVLGIAAMLWPPAATLAAGGAQSAGQADWTVLVYMNGDNNLEPFALYNFAQAAQVGSTDRVNVLIQLDRIGKYSARSANRWSDTVRFRVTPGMVPLCQSLPCSAPDHALGQSIGEADMGAGRTLGEFVSWGLRTYPATHVALVIWDHGQGYRLPNSPQIREPYRSVQDQAPYKSVSLDETNKNQLFNRDAADSLERVLGGRKLDVLGFDACLMAMVETAYGMRTVADVMVASEELSPAKGWNYATWLQRLTTTPSMSGEELGRAIVESYRRENSRSKSIGALSATRLLRAADLARAVGRLGVALRDQLTANAAPLRRAREATPQYGVGNYFPHVDLGTLCAHIAALGDQVRLACTNVVKELDGAVLDTFATGLTTRRGMSGLALYFPSSRAVYTSDKHEQGGYVKHQPKFPVAFVDDFEWSDFLHAYFAVVK